MFCNMKCFLQFFAGLVRESKMKRIRIRNTVLFKRYQTTKIFKLRCWISKCVQAKIFRSGSQTMLISYLISILSLLLRTRIQLFISERFQSEQLATSTFLLSIPTLLLSGKCFSLHETLETRRDELRKIWSYRNMIYQQFNSILIYHCTMF